MTFDYHVYFLTPRQNGRIVWTVPRPRRRNACRLSRTHRFSLFRFRSPLLTESRLFSLPVGTEMFHFPAFPPHALCVQARVTGHDSCRVSPFGNPRITARLTAPRGLSQPPTSFIGSWCQGIHRVPLLTWPQRCSRPLCSSQGTDGPARHHPTTRPSQRLAVPRRRRVRDRSPRPRSPPEGGRGQPDGSVAPARSLAPSGPNSVPSDPPTPARPRSHHPANQEAVLGAGTRPAVPH